MTKASQLTAGSASGARSGLGRSTKTKLPAGFRDEEEGPLSKHWRTYFLAKLVETSNVSLSAKAAGISVSRVYRARRDHAGFAAEWRLALREGYDNLEMELLAYLRAEKPEHKMDVANALRLLAHHRQAVAHERAQDDDRSEQEVLDSIDAMIDEMRQRRQENAAILAEGDPGTPDDED